MTVLASVARLEPGARVTRRTTENAWHELLSWTDCETGTLRCAVTHEEIDDLWQPEVAYSLLEADRVRFHGGATEKLAAVTDCRAAGEAFRRGR